MRPRDCWRQFFKLFFIIEEDKVRLRGDLPVEPENWRFPRDAPYGGHNWRDVGVTSHVIIELARRLDRPVRVIHNDRCIKDFVPNKYLEWAERKHQDHTCLVWNVWGDHAFFYQTTMGMTAMNMRVVEPETVPTVRLQVHPDDMTERRAFADMEPWSPAAFDQAWQDKTPTVFYIQGELYDVAEHLLNAHITFRPAMMSSNRARSFRVPLDCKQRILITSVPKDAHKIAEICHRFTEGTHYQLTYCGEEMPTVVRRMLDEFLVYRRRHIGEEVKSQVRTRQRNICALCPDELGEGGDLHHIQRVADGGADEPENLQYLCQACHKTVHQSNEAAGPRLRSEFNPEMVRLFQESPKPQQITWGVGFPHGQQVRCSDVVGCRQNALLHHEGRLPAFAFADEPQPYLGSDGAPQFPITHYDFYFVDKGKVLEDAGEACGCEARAECELCGGCGLPPARLEHLPYDGAHLYPQLTLRYMLEIGVVGHAGRQVRHPRLRGHPAGGAARRL